MSGVLGAGSSELEKAAQRVTQLKKDPGNEAKLKLYALYKQVQCTLYMRCTASTQSNFHPTVRMGDCIHVPVHAYLFHVHVFK